MTTVKLNIEVTDLYGGEANYSWVRRFVLETDETVSDRAVVRRVKKLIGWSGVRCKVDTFGDTLRIDATPGGWLRVCFVTGENS